MSYKVFTINGSPAEEKGDTALVLGSFLEGIREAGAEIESFYTDRLNIKLCSCNSMYCWSKEPGICCIKDDMQLLYPKLESSEILVLATPVYIPLPGMMQNFLNRLAPLINPQLLFRDGRTRALLHEKVKIRQIVLVSVSGWWEIDNFDTVVHIAEELAVNAGVEFAGSVLRPHAFVMRSKGSLTTDGESVLAEIKRAGNELIKDGAMSPATLQEISRPLLTQEEYFSRYN